LYNNYWIVIYLISPWLHFYIYSTYVYLIPLILPELQIFVSANIGKMWFGLVKEASPVSRFNSFHPLNLWAKLWKVLNQVWGAKLGHQSGSQDITAYTQIFIFLSHIKKCQCLAIYRPKSAHRWNIFTLNRYEYVARWIFIVNLQSFYVISSSI